MTLNENNEEEKNRKNQTVKEQRDRFLAFAFASADLFLEVSEEQRIIFALGAAKGLTGIDDQSLIGKKWQEIFSAYDQATIQHALENAKPGMRCGPLLIDLSEKMGGRKGIFTGIKMPDRNRYYITLGVSSAIMAKVVRALEKPPAPGELLTRENFTDFAEDSLKVAKSIGEDVDMTLLEFDHKNKIAMGEEAWAKLIDSVGKHLLSHSIDGQTAAQITDGRFSVVHDKTIESDQIIKEINKLTKENDPEGKGLDIQSKTISANLSEMSERDAARALIYTINEFERKGTDLTIESLNSGLDSYMEANAQKLKEFQSFIERQSFALHFQPIVNLKTLEVSHYEMLSRFEHGDTQEWVMFGEDVGLAPQFDMAVCERAINYINFKTGGTRIKFSINLSGQSIENYEFFQNLTELLDKNKNLNERLMFEITESNHIQDLNKVSIFVSELQEKGYKVALDDFGAGAVSFQYLQSLKVDLVKIDGKYIRKILSSQRDAAMVKNLARMCKDLDIKVIAEYVEDKAQMEILQTMGVHYGQGYYFGKPKPKPEYNPPKDLDL